jgi:hypothetical protein
MKATATAMIGGITSATMMSFMLRNTSAISSRVEGKLEFVLKVILSVFQ